MTESAHADAETTPIVSLNHFGVYRLTQDYWSLSEAEQLRLRGEWVSRLQEAATVVHHYQTFPAESRTDFLVWSALRMQDPGDARHFLDAYGRALRPFRRYLEAVDVLWGFTRPSQYSRARSRQEIDPFEEREHPYLVMYPFTKTTEWYLTNRDTRQGMMNEHIRIGKQYRDVTQLLVYSVGLQDQEFVVVYETPDLEMFSKLVTDLRHTEARRYTRSDSPLHTAIRRTAADLDSLWP